MFPKCDMSCVIYKVKEVQQVKTNSGKFKYILFTIILVSIVASGCGEVEFTSRWRNREICSDGIDTEWDGARFLVDKKKVKLGFFNDEKYLYIYFSTPDKIIKHKIIARGLTVWFDPDGGTDKNFGIHFPLGRHAVGEPRMERVPPDCNEDPQEMSKESPEEMEIHMPGDDEDIRKVLLADAGEMGISPGISESEGILIYELVIPLTKSELHRYAVTNGKKGIIGVGFETGKFDGEEMQERMRAMPDDFGSGLGRRSSSSMRRSGRNTSGFGPGGEAFESMELWAKVKLAPKPKKISDR